ncbi:hypothetical protein EVAR_53724_1 [Eumeta japonica]|uniref:Uncharacterized protein n=1 Tax=Eumeta variegata TaxID=151549 RepID=A0A4C1Z1C6_EUMVA|nr:hypothetical protein EVAR_53724_1 [Eumeta japonica]
MVPKASGARRGCAGARCREDAAGGSRGRNRIPCRHTPTRRSLISDISSAYSLRPWSNHGDINVISQVLSFAMKPKLHPPYRWKYH